MSEGTIAFEDFQKVDIRVGTILSASLLEGARKPSICLRIDFGELGERQSAAQLTRHYDVTSLVGKQVLAVCNFEPRRIAGFRSEVLVCGFPDGDGEPVLVSPDIAVANGGRLF